MSEEIKDYSEWKHTQEGQRELLVACCQAVAEDPDNPASVAELVLRLSRHADPADAGEAVTKVLNWSLQAEGLLRRMLESAFPVDNDGQKWVQEINDLLTIGKVSNKDYQQEALPDPHGRPIPNG